ncbi:MAG: mycofactocin biosynthesis peptidyl-dipeptidase MftE [Acidimicrobiales bacterium]
MTELALMTWTEVAAVAKGSVLLVPLGATEQHGPHLPIGTDTAIAAAIAIRAAQQADTGSPGASAGGAVLVAPVLPLGSSGEHEDFPGTLSIGQDAVELVLVEVVRSASRHFAAVVLVSCHGGNHEPVRRAVHRLRGEGRLVTAWSPRWPGDAHAGRTETSVLAALDPGLVAARHAAVGETAPLATLLPRLRSEGVRAVSPSGVLGDPTGATATEGLELLDTAVTDLVAHLDAVRAGLLRRAGGAGRAGPTSADPAAPRGTGARERRFPSRELASPQEVEP